MQGNLSLAFLSTEQNKDMKNNAVVRALAIDTDGLAVLPNGQIISHLHDSPQKPAEQPG